MNKIKTHKDLDVWKKSVDLVTSIYEVTKAFPKDEILGLIKFVKNKSSRVHSLLITHY